MTKLKKISPKEIIKLEYESLERLYKSEIDILGWGKYTDVLYSFLGIFTLGIYIFEKDKAGTYSIGSDNIIRLKGTKQWLYSRRYIIENYKSFSEVNELEVIKGFAQVYNSIGNIAPIWPGGNEFKGKSGCYDIPEIFFFNYGDMEKVYIECLLKKEVKDVALTRFVLDLPLCVNKIEDVLHFDEKQYIKFVQHIIDEINKRSAEIEELLNVINKKQ